MQVRARLEKGANIILCFNGSEFSYAEGDIYERRASTALGGSWSQAERP
jgi:hypothetical protein